MNCFLNPKNILNIYILNIFLEVISPQQIYEPLKGESQSDTRSTP